MPEKKRILHEVSNTAIMGLDLLYKNVMFSDRQCVPICGSTALLDLSMQDERRAWTQAPKAKELTKGAINLRLSYQTEVRGNSPSPQIK